MNGAQPRVSSPRSGSSTLITSAPMSPSSIVQNGPASTRVRSMTFSPSSAGICGTCRSVAPSRGARGERKQFLSRQLVDVVDDLRVGAPDLLQPGGWHPLLGVLLGVLHLGRGD